MKPTPRITTATARATTPNRRSLAVAGALLLVLALAPALTHRTQPRAFAAAVEQATARYHEGLGAWVASTRALDTVARAALARDSTLAADVATHRALRDAHAEARRAYKRVEWLAAYFDEGAVNRFVNGAPLPKVEQKVAELRVLEPLGLQVLEEEVYAEAPDARAVADLSDELAANAPVIARDLRRRPVRAADLYAAARYGLVRVFTLGVTGFDTPASDGALAESRESLAAIGAGILPVVRAQDRLPAAVLDSIETAFAAGGAQLAAADSAGDFRGFDRLRLLRTAIDPLYSALLSAHLASGAELPHERSVLPQGHNYLSRSVLAEDFLNDYVYAGQAGGDTLFSRKRDLGERLFRETAMSVTGTMSCASCHDPERAFTDGQTKSLGNDGRPLRRNAPTLMEAVYADRFFADLREPTLARQIRHVIQDAHEFGTDYLTLLDTLRAREDYRAAFAKTYPDLSEGYRISTYTVSDVLVSYVRTLHTRGSAVDRFVRADTAAIAPAVRRGFNLFMGEAACGTCHFAPTFAGLVPPFYRETESEVLGVPSAWPMTDSTGIDPDPGRIASGQPLDGAPFYRFSFKTPTVRHVAQTAPYMHNGAFADLAGVVDFYAAGGGAGLGLDVPHQTLPFDSLELSARDRADLVAFMEAL